MPVGWLHASRSARCLILDFSDSAQELFALYFRSITAWRLTALRAPGDSCTKIIFRPHWSGAGLEAAYGGCCFSEEWRLQFAGTKTPRRRTGHRGDAYSNLSLFLRWPAWRCTRFSIFLFRSPPFNSMWPLILDFAGAAADGRRQARKKVGRFTEPPRRLRSLRGPLG